MGSPSGNRLTSLALVLAALAAAWAVGLAATGRFAVSGPVAAPGPSAAESVALAQEAERKGEVAEALSAWRRAVSADPRLLDRRSTAYLGAGFEAGLKERISGLKSGRIKAGPSALPDASYLFRRLYGGCG